ncbi:MAG: pyridoxamine 5'-phosphate oxidase family protein [Holophagaceae bacterium]|uniref:Pyridoxamine 5'-phosphate oxidase family protein n=1 Tax=Candidatus Geothrix skivensis TaxID=2954439 RepID=A0A9D7XGK4_9BACT|nr:pyridoxamine 5'-phosphate oxidase family protein [Candidatus Geothrix skivensis]
MNPAQSLALRDLLSGQPIASLGTLHDGEPFVSMVPFALLPGGPDFLIHVSQMSAHTQDMLSSPPVSLLVIAPPNPDVPPQAQARVTVQGLASRLDESDPVHAAAQAAYLARFPQSAPMFELDFSLFAIRPRMLRFVGGFGQALSLTPEMFAGVLSKA